MQDLVNFVMDGLEKGDPLVLGVLVAFAVVALTILILAVRGGSNKRRGVLLVGLCDAGKSLIYSRLVFKKFALTHTSIKENDGTYELEGKKAGKTLRIIDLPGHERIRVSKFDQYKKAARALVFVVDSLTFQKEIKDVADYLYSILTDPVISSYVPPVLIACNKHDQTMAKGAKVVQAQLEKEMNTVRLTKSAALSGTTDSGNNNVYLGKRNKPFSFADVKPFRIEFAECSAKGVKDSSDGDLDAIVNWLEQIA